MSELITGVTSAERRKALLHAADTVAAYKQQQKDIADAIADVKAVAAAKLGLAPKALDAALKYLHMSDGERMDIDTALTMAQQALSEVTTGDLFAAQVEASALERDAARKGRRGGSH